MHKKIEVGIYELICQYCGCILPLISEWWEQAFVSNTVWCGSGTVSVSCELYLCGKSVHWQYFCKVYVTEKNTTEKQSVLEKSIWFSENISNDGLLLCKKNMFFSDETWFKLSENINSHNYRCFCFENCHWVYEVSLHDPEFEAGVQWVCKNY